jgi:hypothetical protein
MRLHVLTHSPTRRHRSSSTNSSRATTSTTPTYLASICYHGTPLPCTLKFHTFRTNLDSLRWRGPPIPTESHINDSTSYSEKPKQEMDLRRSPNSKKSVQAVTPTSHMSAPLLRNAQPKQRINTKVSSMPRVCLTPSPNAGAGLRLSTAGTKQLAHSPT